MTRSSILAALRDDVRRVEGAAYRAEPLSAEDEADLIPLVDEARAILGRLPEALEALRR